MQHTVPRSAAGTAPLRRLAMLAVLLLVPARGGAGEETRDPAFGHWLTANERAIVRIAPCDGEACGTIVWTRGQGRNCGTRILGELTREAPGRWTGGYVLDPRKGSRYGAELSAEGARLTLRGYLGLPLLGRSQVWTRVEGDRGGCPAVSSDPPLPEGRGAD